MSAHEMPDKRRSDDYQRISANVPLEVAQEFKIFCACEGLSQSEALKEMTHEWLAKINASNSSKPKQADSEITIADLVRANMRKFKHSGVKNLKAIAKGEVLPTIGDFAIITSTLGIPEEEQKIIWQRTFICSDND
jgi:hypothetical protein